MLERRFPFMLGNKPRVMNKRWLGSIYLRGFSLGLVLCVLSIQCVCNISIFNGLKLLNN